MPINQLQTRLDGFQDDLAVSDLMSIEKRTEVIRYYEESLRQLFLQTFCNSHWSIENETQAEQLLHSEVVPANALSLFSSAIMLSLIKCFDVRKLVWLFQAYQSAHVQVSQRALEIGRAHV